MERSDHRQFVVSPCEINNNLVLCALGQIFHKIGSIAWVLEGRCFFYKEQEQLEGQSVN